jgi:predicted Fe-Mo cluster-binding NifX family protein
MKIAIPVLENKGENSPISEHFGHSPFFAFVNLKGKNFTVEVEKNPLENHNPGEIPEYLKNKEIDLLIARGMGQKALVFFEQFGIKVIRGASGTVREIINKYLEKELKDTEYEVKEKFHEH